MPTTIVAASPDEPERSKTPKSRGRKRANGEGTLTRRSDGSWQDATYVTTTAGRRVRKYVYGKTREDVRKKLTALQRSADQGIPFADRAWKVGEYLEYWLNHVVKPQRRLKTWVGYEGIVRLYLKPGLATKKLDKLSAKDVRLFLTECREICLCCKYKRDCSVCAYGSDYDCCEEAMSVRQLQFIHAVLRNALQNAVREEILMRNVAKLVQVETPDYSAGKGLSVEAAKDLLVTVRKDRLYALYVLALLGLRKGELLGLRWEDVDLEAGTLEVRQSLQRVSGELRMSPPKTRYSRRVIPLPDFWLEALRGHRTRQAEEKGVAVEWINSGHVFTTGTGRPIDPRNLNRQFYRVREAAGLSAYRFHDLRHTAVSLLLDLGVPPHVVRETVGHSAIEVTMTIYAHASLEEKQKALRRLGKEIA
jgi:integrase